MTELPQRMRTPEQFNTVVNIIITRYAELRDAGIAHSVAKNALKGEYIDFAQWAYYQGEYETDPE